MDVAAELGRSPVSKHRFSLSMEMSRLTRDGTVKPASRDQILRRERGQGKNHFPRSASHEQDWQPYPVDPYPCLLYVITIIHTCIYIYDTKEELIRGDRPPMEPYQRKLRKKAFSR